ncbi:hypothetical protein BDW74DRAFT_187170 [Aspergillus multicolor]|uniref:uncharacterized protein n=1 Tax=Aspergillus multicolor TaxID=41759 RepID=UPI003CCD48A6
MQELGQAFGLSSATRMLQYTSASFDPSILETFGTLIHGGCVCMPTEEQRLNDIPAAVRQMQVNTAVFVPSVLKLLRPEEIPTVRKLIIGGEKLTSASIERWAHRMQLINAYGPTETCVCSVASLHDSQRLVPIGAVGELWIEGPTVAQGYLNNQQATEKSFAMSLPAASPLGSRDRAYRTGDLVRYLLDGRLLFLGRRDKQVKVNGQRVELEEIEAALCRFPLVADASVQLVKYQCSSSLAAFVTPAGQSPDPEWIEAIRDSLASTLPAHMIPDYLVPIENIPRMTSGKADSNRLKTILEEYRSAKNGKQDAELPLQSATHTLMRDLWTQTLDLAPSSISPTDRFLHLGGNSIKAMQLVGNARRSGLSLSVAHVLENRTLPELAELATPTAIPAAPCTTPAVSLTTVGAFPEGNYTRLILALHGRLDISRLHDAVRALVAHTEILCTQFSRSADGTMTARVSEPGGSDVPLLHLRDKTEADAHWAAEPESCFDRPLVDFSFLVVDAQRTHLALGLQHALYDAWTVPLLLHHLPAFYNGLSVPASMPFSTYAAHLPSEINDTAESFWKSQLADLSMTLLASPAPQSNLDLPDSHLKTSITLPTQTNFTFATTLNSAWALVLSQSAKTNRIVFGGAVSGRNIDLDGILDLAGPCINMVPFAVNISSCTRFLDILHTVQSIMAATVPYEAMPLPEIIARCTDWDVAGVFGSIVQHLDITFEVPRCPEDAGLQWEFVETRKRYGRCRATDVYIFSTVTGGVAQVEMKFNPARIGTDLAGRLFADLVRFLGVMLETPQLEIEGL